MFRPFVNPDRLARAIQKLTAEIEADNCQIEVGNDMRRFIALCELMDGKSPSAEFDFLSFDFNDVNSLYGAIWKGREPIARFAARLEYTGSKTLAEVWGSSGLQGQQHRIYDRGGAGATIGLPHADAANEISGWLAYAGDMRVKKGAGGAGLGTRFSRLSQLYILDQWRPDFSYAYNPKHLAGDGWTAKQGYLHWAPRAVGWTKPPNGIRADDLLVYNRFRDLVSLMHAVCDDTF